MLLRKQANASDMEDADFDAVSPEPDQAAPKAERRRAERRSMDSLRADVLRTLAPELDEKKSGAARPKVARPGLRMKPSRILLLVIALFAGGLAAVLATQREQPAVQQQQQTAAEPIPEVRARILVAKEAIGMGQRLTPASVEWQDWPEGALRSEYITIAAMPEAITDLNGSVARFEFFPGEPIRDQKLVHADQGYLSAVLDPGMRGVSVSVAAESASGGFIVPNDHVDVVVTRISDLGQDSETILHNVRVLAINSRLGEMGTTGAPTDPANPRAEIFADQAIATLELDRTQAEVIISAAAGGKLSLVLLSLTDAGNEAAPGEQPANAAIRISSPFWKN